MFPKAPLSIHTSLVQRDVGSGLPLPPQGCELLSATKWALETIIPSLLCLRLRSLSGDKKRPPQAEVPFRPPGWLMAKDIEPLSSLQGGSSFCAARQKQTMAVLPPMASTRKRRAGSQLLKTVAVELPAPQEPDFNPLSDNLRDQLSLSPRQCQLSKRPPRGKEKPSKGSERMSKLEGSSWLLTPISVTFKSAVPSLWVFHRVT